jgi:hypothetical protein
VASQNSHIKNQHMSPDMNQMMENMGGMSQRDLNKYVQEMTKHIPADQLNDVMKNVGSQFPQMSGALRKKMKKVQKKNQKDEKHQDNKINTKNDDKNNDQKAIPNQNNDQKLSQVLDPVKEEEETNIHPAAVGQVKRSLKKNVQKTEIKMPELKDFYAHRKNDQKLASFEERLKIWKSHPIQFQEWTKQVISSGDDHHDTSQIRQSLIQIQPYDIPSVIPFGTKTPVTIHEIPDCVKSCNHGEPQDKQQVLFKKFIFEYDATSKSWFRYRNIADQIKDLKQRYLKIQHWLEQLQQHPFLINRKKIFDLLEPYSIYIEPCNPGSKIEPCNPGSKIEPCNPGSKVEPASDRQWNLRIIGPGYIDTKSNQMITCSVLWLHVVFADVVQK